MKILRIFGYYVSGYNHTERQAERQAARQASTLAAAAASPMQVYGDASLDAPNGSQIHCINLTLHLPLTLDATLDARCGLALRRIAFELRELNYVFNVDVSMSQEI